MYLDSEALPWKKYLIGFTKPFVIAGILSMSGGALHAMDIYRWVDASGQTHMSDRVPEQYKAVAKRIDSKQFDISEADRMQAQDRAAKEKLATERKKVDEVAPPTPANFPKTTESGPQSTCSQKWDEYYSSQECFAPYLVLTPNGRKISEEGYARCQIVESPYTTCEYDKRLSR